MNRQPEYKHIVQMIEAIKRDDFNLGLESLKRIVQEKRCARKAAIVKKAKKFLKDMEE